MQDGKKTYFQVVRYVAFMSWPTAKDVGINAFDADGNLFAFDLTILDARLLADSLYQAAAVAEDLTRQLQKDEQLGR